jgi:hypothetical protein
VPESVEIDKKATAEGSLVIKSGLVKEEIAGLDNNRRRNGTSP